MAVNVMQSDYPRTHQQVRFKLPKTTQNYLLTIVYSALIEVTRWFQVPLERANVDTSLVQEEWDDIVEYGKQYWFRLRATMLMNN